METIEIQTTPEAKDQHISVFLRVAESYISARENLYGRLMEMPLEVFGKVIEPALAPTSRVLDLGEMARVNLLKEVVMEVVRERSICNWCYAGYESRHGGRNGGEGYTRCSNPECLSQKF